MNNNSNQYYYTIYLFLNVLQVFASFHKVSQFNIKFYIYLFIIIIIHFKLNIFLLYIIIYFKLNIFLLYIIIYFKLNIFYYILLYILCEKNKKKTKKIKPKKTELE